MWKWAPVPCVPGQGRMDSLSPVLYKYLVWGSAKTEILRRIALRAYLQF